MKINENLVHVVANAGLNIFLGFRQVAAVVIALHILEDGFHLLGLTLPFLLVHLGLTAEELFVGLPVATTQTVPEGSKLSVVVVEVQVMHGVASSSVDHRAVGHILAIMDQDSPEVNESKEEDVGELLEREDEREQVVGHTLGPAIQRVESMRGVRARHDPLVVRLVQRFVDARVVQAAVDPVNAKIGERDEQWELDDAVELKWLLRERIV